MYGSAGNNGPVLSLLASPAAPVSNDGVVSIGLAAIMFNRTSSDGGLRKYRVDKLLAECRSHRLLASYLQLTDPFHSRLDLGDATEGFLGRWGSALRLLSWRRRFRGRAGPSADGSALPGAPPYAVAAAVSVGLGRRVRR
jgi:hypothetical protein